MLTTKEIFNFIKSKYDFTDFKNISKRNTKSHNYIYNLKDVNNKNYIIKIYRNFDLDRIKNEQEINKYLKSKISFVASPYKNINNELVSVDYKRKMALILLPNIQGFVFKNGKKLTEKQIKTAAYWLANLHNIKYNSKFIKKNNLKEDISVGIKTYKKIIKKISQKKYLDVFEKTIKEILISRVSIAEECLVDSMENSFIHGDFAPSNIIFNKNNLSIIDWERTKYYFWQYDLFRGLSNFSSTGRYTPYDSAKDLQKISLFLKYYSQKIKKISNKEKEILKKMPRIFCFIDVYPFDSYFLKKQFWTKKFLPTNKKEFFWWKDNEVDFINLVDKYFK